MQPGDRHLSCNQIAAQIQSNNAEIERLAGQKGAKVAQNVAAGIAGLVIPVLWFGMDFKDAAGQEAQALMSRNNNLVALARDKKC